MTAIFSIELWDMPAWPNKSAVAAGERHRGSSCWQPILSNWRYKYSTATAQHTSRPHLHPKYPPRYSLDSILTARFRTPTEKQSTPWPAHTLPVYLSITAHPHDTASRFHCHSTRRPTGRESPAQTRKSTESALGRRDLHARSVRPPKPGGRWAARGQHRKCTRRRAWLAAADWRGAPRRASAAPPHAHRRTLAQHLARRRRLTPPQPHRHSAPRRTRRSADILKFHTQFDFKISSSPSKRASPSWIFT